MKDLEKLYRDYFETVYKYLFSITRSRDLSEELTQETFYQAMKTYDSFRGDAKVSVWLCQIAKHLWYKEYKRSGSHTSDSLEDLSDLIPSESTVEQKVVESDAKLKMYQKLQKLDEKTREVMYLRLTGELSFREIGEILEKNETWARVTFYRGKQKIMREEEKE
ncbi:RNA polymerase sigma factor [Proteiniclasticum sp. C24MP]|uniref:RNA polymerase sigma factor n=1 Tax=Proteiniclasticum sp. C24MP TaxID=3374101 RepID=UPI0037552C98